MWLVNGSVVDVTTGEILRDRSIEIGSDGIINQVTAEKIPVGVAPKDVIDLQGRFLLPGLISCHSHLSIVFPFSDTDESELPAITAYRAATRARQALIAGITTLRCVHEQNQIDLALRTAAQRGWIDSPRIFGAGRAIGTPHGHGQGAGCSYAEGHNGFYQAALTELESGADHVKIFINGGLARAGESPEQAEMTDAEIAGTVKAANEHNTYVVAHSGESGAITQALRQGVRSFEHIYHLDETTAQSLASAGAFATPTLCVTRSEPWMRATGFAEASIQNALAVSDEHLDSVKNAIRAGVQLVNGTDIPPGDLVDGLPAALYELFLMFEAGLTPLQTLQSVSTTAAKLLNHSSTLGQIAPGFVGDFIAVAGDPLKNMDTLRNISLVMQGGEVIRDTYSAV